MDERLKSFRCRYPGNCLMGLDKGLTDDYSIEGTKVLFRGKEIGDLAEESLTDIICDVHCNQRFLDEVLAVPGEQKPRLRVVRKFSIKKQDDHNL